jgi:DNA-directed RNA polymerase specialized sigma24 family protein
VNRRGTCSCALCRMEIHLFEEVREGKNRAYEALLVRSPQLGEFPTLSALLARLRAWQADLRSDEIFGALLAADPANWEFVESFFVLAFLPMIHGTVRKITKQHPELAKDDIIQQALSFLVQFLRSAELGARRSHFAFVISRAVKRQSFEWANRERTVAGNQDMAAGVVSALLVEEPFEQHAMLRHFLHRCVSKGLLHDAELDLLLQFKLEGNSSEDLGNSAGISANALRQRMKRLLAKLRRLARTNGHVK